ncbi:transposase [Amycolatopsis thermophila]|uniref:Transposase n=1 Tax=Amycolatopsis thermophila TaxID=206084 RepID=A0ABU0F1L4_9PSEU|nr:transposase [Amycolatopsis thermophila]MDQ0381470.1 putative transposase [Amycolatopsis thermophila]
MVNTAMRIMAARYPAELVTNPLPAEYDLRKMVVSRCELLSDEQWALIEDLLPARTGRPGRPFSDARAMVEGIIYRYRCGIARRDVPAVSGPWQTIWTWHRRMAREGTWEVVLQRLQAFADAAGLIDWSVSVDSSIAQAHQHATNITRHTGGWTELHETRDRAA